MLHVALLQMVVGEQDAEELPAVAADALSKGKDCPSLRSLAVAARTAVDENRASFLGAMRELGCHIPDLQSARRGLVRYWACEIVEGTLTPHIGARRIWLRGWEPLGRPAHLAIFVGLAGQWEERPAGRATYEQEIIAAARALLDAG